VPVLDAFETGTVAGECAAIHRAWCRMIFYSASHGLANVNAKTLSHAFGMQPAGIMHPIIQHARYEEHFVEASVYERLHRSNGWLDAALPG
jgi:hypothetical protein